MKKLLLIGVAALLSFSASSQVAISKVSVLQSQKSVIDNKAEKPFIGLKPYNFALNNTKSLSVSRFGSSINAYTLLSGENHNLAAISDLNLIMFTHRAGGPCGGNGGDIRIHFTSDYGVTWDSITFPQSTGNLLRYPGGAIYNPTGNTNVNNADFCISGPVTNGADWVNNFYGSGKLDSTALQFKLVPMPADTFSPCYLNLNIYNGGKVRVGGAATYEAGTGQQYLYSRSGIFAADTIQWNNYVRINNLFKFREFTSGKSNCSFNSNVTFKDDGELGYFFTIGRDSLDDPNNAQEPIVWKTNDGGATWAKQPIFDFSTLTGLTDYIWPTMASSGDSATFVFRPNFPAGATSEEGTIPCAVDANGTLHLGCVVEGLYSTDPDSLNYSYTKHPIVLFDVTLTSAGVWDAKFVSYISGSVVLAADGGWGAGDVAQGWDHSIHITMSPDKNKVFYMWTDTDTVQWATTLNIYPDIFGRGFDITNGHTTLVKSFTTGTTLGWSNYLMNNADFAILDGTTYKIPTTIAERGNTPDDALYHLFMSGLTFEESDFDPNASINENTESTISAAAIYPNPATDNTNINLNLISDQKIQVNVLNMIGQNMISKDFGMMNAGNQTLSINTSNLSRGIYMINIIAGNDQVTRKLVIE